MLLWVQQSGLGLPLLPQTQPHRETLVMPAETAAEQETRAHPDHHGPAQQWIAIPTRDTKARGETETELASEVPGKSCFDGHTGTRQSLPPQGSEECGGWARRLWVAHLLLRC